VVKGQVVGEPEREVTIRKDDGIIYEILGGAFEMEEFPNEDKLKLLTKPFRMEDGQAFKFERARSIVMLSLNFTTWDHRLLRFGVEVPPKATIEAIVTEAQKKAEESREDVKFYSMFRNGQPASSPWTQAAYELRPNRIVASVVTAKTRNGEMTVAVPTNHPEVWQQIFYQAIPDPPLR
jgi:hypothetical protein